MDIARHQVSGDRSLSGDTNGSTLLDLIPAEDTTEEFETQFDVETLLGKLQGEVSPRDYKIIVSRYGLVDGSALSLSEVAEQYDITRARVHQIEKKVLKKLQEIALRN